MNIVIIGAGNIGQYLAEILSKEQFNVTLIDKDEEALQSISESIDVAVRYGEGTDWQLLDELLEFSPDLLIAASNDDQSNLVACAIAKNLGYPRTIARISDGRFLNSTRLDFGRIFDADYFVSPELLVANDIYKFMSSPGSLAVETFAHGAVQLRTIVVPRSWRKSDVRLCDLNLPEGMMIGLIRRKWVPDDEDEEQGVVRKRVIFPHGSDCIYPGDEVTLIGETDVIADVHYLFGSSKTMVKSVVLVGGSLTAVNLAKVLRSRSVDVRIIEKDERRCSQLIEQLPTATVIHGDGTNMDLLMSENVAGADMVVACTARDEVNLMIAMVTKEAGCEDVVIMLSDMRYTSFVDRLGINHTASPRISAANRILSLIRIGTVSSMVSLYEHQAEIIELHVSKDSKVAGIPIAELGPQLPKDFLIAVIQNRGRIMVANGNRILSPGDTVIVVADPKHIDQLEKVF